MARRQCSEDAIVQMLDECDLSDLEDILSESSVEINKHKIFDANNTWITELYEGWNFNSGNYLFTTDTK